MKKYILIVIILLVAASIVLGLYWMVFHEGFSYNSADWGNFGSYFNGLLMPILTFVNIIVFVSISMKLSALDDKRAEKEVEGQKNLMLMQFRKKEIDNFERVLNEALIPSLQFVISKEVLARPIVLADMYLHSFLKSKLSLFNLTEDSETTQSVSKLKCKLSNYHTKFVSDEKFVRDDIMGLLELKSSIISNLQKITIEDFGKEA
ncbi:MAG: hypothetical protein IKX24_06825 [Prevotella sp.]|nr:hypothetical protein [Prevotella sp.]